MQKIFVTGFVGRDPEERITYSGKKLITFPLAINCMKAGEKITVWYKINCWGDQFSSILPHIKKGNCLTVVGDLHPPTTYQNKKGDISIDMTITCLSISFSPTGTAKEEKKQDDAIFDFEDET